MASHVTRRCDLFTDKLRSEWDLQWPSMKQVEGTSSQLSWERLYNGYPWDQDNLWSHLSTAKFRRDLQWPSTISKWPLKAPRHKQVKKGSTRAIHVFKITIEVTFQQLSWDKIYNGHPQYQNDNVDSHCKAFLNLAVKKSLQHGWLL